MGLTDWMGTFGRAQSLDLSSDLERGYEAALLIQSIEMEHYNDRPVRPELELRIPRAMQAQVLRRFRAALQVCRQARTVLTPYRQELSGQELRQFQLIDMVTGRYAVEREELPALSRSPEMLPRSLVSVVDTVRRQLDPEAEASVLAGFRRRRDSTLVSLRILLLLILVPVLVQQVSRTYVVSPLVDRFAPDNAFLTYPKPHLEERAVEKLRVYQAEIEFDALLEGKPLPSREELQVELAKRAHVLKEEADQESTHAIKNVLADISGFIGFVVIAIAGRRDLQVLRGFIDELVYGLSDSAKAFAIILFTDIFVGFHSPEGWTVLLNGVAHHLGLPARENFVMLFIATFPVVLATIFKYWIFRYLNRVSPSSVATLRNMNGGG
ncbi:MULTISPECIES: proton extrusion protein PcxA [unclassified Cyanobium]|uniref:proton extrusion protein PcxA n=1 Tax=unclassified Cyanobium TaxID=2627006 RepID=UPI0020CC0926|nr:MULTISPECIES: proton extrusion protein PcxA [unclassified Cyanobium]MCP9858255.1 proton extrusion protein PcxA [Cyanobium sp. Cruz-8H5]MCP9865636.1 proton extrusion protein PcxA [Cyanobium sp. Cruz-8D1]